MGEIIEGTRRHYVGLDADKDTIPAGGKAFGDSYHANDKGKQYYWNGAAWKTGLGYEFVPRAIAAWDWAVGDFPNKDAWQPDDLNVTGIVPEGAKSILFTAVLSSTAASKYFELRPNATTKVQNSAQLRAQVANVFIYRDMVLYNDADRLIDYQINTEVTVLGLGIVGWWI